MGEIRSDGTIKAVYYKKENLTEEEKQRYYTFETMLAKDQISKIKEWYNINIFNFALIDEDYIFFTTKNDYYKFIIFWNNLLK